LLRLLLRRKTINYIVRNMFQKALRLFQRWLHVLWRSSKCHFLERRQWRLWQYDHGLRWREQFGRSVLKSRPVGAQMTQVTKAKPRSKTSSRATVSPISTQMFIPMLSFVQPTGLSDMAIVCSIQVVCVIRNLVSRHRTCPFYIYLQRQLLIPSRGRTLILSDLGRYKWL
jgi:hypothetical protein